MYIYNFIYVFFHLHVITNRIFNTLLRGKTTIKKEYNYSTQS